ncbi:MAG: protein kinase [Planctomycetia bacterium]|nr:protein kinase [Planctomycetia bacterium]
MADYSVDELVKMALSNKILDMPQLQEIWTTFGTQNVETEAFLQALMRYNILTKYQVERLVAGETSGFYYGDYKVLYLVGAGSFARVYRAVHNETEKVAAVKVLRARYRDDQNVIDHFIREAELGMELHHPNIATIYDISSDNNDYFMSMDFIEGQTLRDILRIQKKIEPKIAVRIITDICHAMDYALKRGHQHRDIKLTNIILSSSGKSVLVDFGLAATEEEKSIENRNQRAIDYAALEKATGVQRNDRRSDIYFLGTIFYHMLTGESPLPITKETSRSQRMDRGRFLNIRPIREKYPEVPYVLSFIVGKAMSFDPEGRYQSPGAMLADLEIAVKKLNEGKTTEVAHTDLGLANAAKQQSVKSTLMIVEANPEMQNIFRESFKKAGYRVLIISDTVRALERFDDHSAQIDCVLLNAQSLGIKAVEMFNLMAKDPFTKNLPIILLLDESQIKWAAKAERCKWRLAVVMPITIRRLQEVLSKLLETNVSQKASAAKVQLKHYAEQDDELNKKKIVLDSESKKFQQTSPFAKLDQNQPISTKPLSKEDFLSSDNIKTTEEEEHEKYLQADYEGYVSDDNDEYRKIGDNKYPTELFDKALDQAIELITSKAKDMTEQQAASLSHPDFSLDTVQLAHIEHEESGSGSYGYIDED